MARILWMERKFNFEFPHELYPEILERLRGTPGRLDELIKSIPPGILALRNGERWSIMENVGHMGDVEPIWVSRVEDILAGKKTMREADLSNQATYKADHNNTIPSQSLARFWESRAGLILNLNDLASDDFAKSSVHPRLKIPMRLVDLCLFIAEHDDYHLATIREMAKIFGWRS